MMQDSDDTEKVGLGPQPEYSKESRLSLLGRSRKRDAHSRGSFGPVTACKRDA